MSQELNDLFDPFHQSKFNHSFFNTTLHDQDQDQDQEPFIDPSSYMSFTDCVSGSNDYSKLSKSFGLSPNFPSITKVEESKAEVVVGGGDQTPITGNSSVFSSSSEACEDHDISSKKEKHSDEKESSKKITTAKGNAKKAKKEKEPRFAFMTKSEVDHLEDGYRWRKYGQKAVKNSPYPRSYYRCTTQKCTVKKRVERSYQDPSIVMTTYEGQHNHHLPATLRGNMTGMFHQSLMNPAHGVAGFSQESLLAQMMPSSLYNHHNYNNVGTATANSPSTMYQQSTLQQLQLLNHDYGLLQDMVPNSMISKQDP
jgi:hypothetical protein